MSFGSMPVTVDLKAAIGCAATDAGPTPAANTENGARVSRKAYDVLNCGRCDEVLTRDLPCRD